MTGRKLRDNIVSQGRYLAARGLSPGSSGNMSARLGDGWLMTPTGTSLGALVGARLSHLDHNGHLIGGGQPTKELPLHLAMYSEQPAIRAIVHLHSSHAVAVACLKDLDPDNVLPPLTPYYVMRVGRVALVPYARPGRPELAEGVRARARDNSVLLLANHGPIVAGGSLDAASTIIEEVEEACKLFLLLQGLASRPLSQADVVALGQLG